MDTSSYLQRIGFSGEADSSLATLEKIHQLHPCAIAFENINSFIAERVSLQPDAVFEKLVTQGRGGYCFEQNLILASILKKLGFQVTEHAARVLWRSPEKTEMARTHMLLKVDIDEQSWIADVGFGGLTMTAPLRLEPELVQYTPNEAFKISRDGDEFTIAVSLNGEWKQMYVFDLVPQYPVDFEMANHYVATHPQSHFVDNLVIARADTDSRHALENRTYTRYTLKNDVGATDTKSEAGGKSEKFSQRIVEFNELLDLLGNTFKVALNKNVDVTALQKRWENLP